MQYNEDVIRELQRSNRKLENNINALKKKLVYMETYSRRENLKFFGLPENTDVSYGRNNKEEGSSRQHGDPENTKKIF